MACHASTAAALGAMLLIGLVAPSVAFGHSTGFENGKTDFEYLDHMGSGKITLRYFDLRGRAEGIRLLLEYLEVPYKDVRYSWDQWLEVKKSGKFAFEQLPALTYCPDPDGDEGSPSCVNLVQSHTILRFLARRFGVYGPENLRHWVDLVADGAEDARSQYGKIAYNKNCQDLLPEYLEKTMPTWLGHLERLKGAHIDAPRFFTGDNITHADLLAFNVIELNERIAGPDLLHTLPHLHAFKHSMLENSALARYVRSERRPTHANGASACLDSASNPAPHSGLYHTEEDEDQPAEGHDGDL